MTETATIAVLPLWLEIIVAALVLSGAGLALLGSTACCACPRFLKGCTRRPSSPRWAAG
jgi:multicomponent K+:H+ antiporter subunit G